MGHSGKAWENGRRKALERDNYQCQDCGVKDKSVHAHHIRRPEEFASDEAAHHESNLVALCKHCHPKWEDIAARPILLNDRGVNLHEVVGDMSLDTIRRLALERMGGVFDRLVERDGEVCNECFSRVSRNGGKRPMGRSPNKPAENFNRVLKRVVDKTVVAGVIPNRHGRSQSTTCPRCEARMKDTLSKDETIEMMHNVVNRLEKRRIPFDRDTGYETVRQLKSDPDTSADPEQTMLRRGAQRGIRVAMEKRELHV